MKKLNRKIALFILSNLLIIPLLFAQDQKQGRKEAQKEIKAYMESAIFPTLQQSRSELDSKLSEDDKSLLTEIREEVKKSREEANVFKEEIRALRKSGQELSDAQKIKFAELHLAKDKHQQKIRPIIERNEELLRETLEGLKEEGKVWKEDIEEIRKSHGVEGHPNKGRRGKRGGDNTMNKGKHRKGKEGRRRGGMSRLKRLMSPEGFLLWNGSLERGVDLDTSEEISGVMAYPNPSNSTSSKISFTTATKGKVNVFIMNSNGEKVKTLVDKTLKSGEHTFELVTSDLENGVYFYNIVTPAGSEVKRFVVRK